MLPLKSWKAVIYSQCPSSFTMQEKNNCKASSKDNPSQSSLKTQQKCVLVSLFRIFLGVSDSGVKKLLSRISRLANMREHWQGGLMAFTEWEITYLSSESLTATLNGLFQHLLLSLKNNFFLIQHVKGNLILVMITVGLPKKKTNKRAIRDFWHPPRFDVDTEKNYSGSWLYHGIGI